jgi:hypothetical protein
MDMAATLQAVVDASALPLSLLIVGVGDADFGAMEVRRRGGRAPRGARPAPFCSRGADATAPSPPLPNLALIH